MSQVFSNAPRVYVWLGPSNGQTVEAITLMMLVVRRLHTMSASKDKIMTWMSGLSTYEIFHTGYIELSDYSKFQWLSLWNFYEAAWFFRVWVVQEVQNSKQVRLLSGESRLNENMRPL